MINEIKKDLINLVQGNIDCDLDTILQNICKLSDNNVKYDVLIHRFFEEEIGHMGIPNGWFCHIVTWEYDFEKDDFIKNKDKSIKVFGCCSPKKAVIECLKLMFKDEI